MGGTTLTANARDKFGNDEIEAFQSRLTSLARETIDYPLECSFGTCAFLFESRDDIEVILGNLNEEISVSRRTA